MRNTTRLISVLALASALGGCSMAGTNDLFTDHHGQSAQGSQYWGGGQSDCLPAPAQFQAPAPVTTGCGSAYAVAPQNVQTYDYSAPVAPQYQAPVLQNQVVQGQAYQLPQGYAGYQGQPVYPQGGFAPAYVNPRGGSTKSLRPSYAYANLGVNTFDVDSDIYGAQARLGYQSSYFLGAEVEGALGFTNDNTSFNTGGDIVAASTSVDTQIAGFGVLRYPATKKINVLGRFGYHNTEGDIRLDDGVNQLSGDFSEDGIAYGGGVEYAFTNNMGLRVDYTRYEVEGPDLDSVSVALTRKF